MIPLADGVAMFTRLYVPGKLLLLARSPRTADVPSCCYGYTTWYVIRWIRPHAEHVVYSINITWSSPLICNEMIYR